jgi:phage terminase small subunit
MAGTPKPTASKPLTPKVAAFVREYLIDKNATQAAIRAGYSPRSAGQHGNGMLKLPHIKAAITRELKAQAERTLITADKVLLDIVLIGDKALKAREFSVALRSRELIGKHYKVFTDKTEHSGPNGGPIEYTEVRRTIVDPKAPTE